MISEEWFCDDGFSLTVSLPSCHEQHMTIYNYLNLVYIAHTMAHTMGQRERERERERERSSVVSNVRKCIHIFQYLKCLTMNWYSRCRPNRCYCPAVISTWWNKKARLSWLAIAAANCTNVKFSPQEMRLYMREFQYQGCKLWSLLNARGYQTMNTTHLHLHFTLLTN